MFHNLNYMRILFTFLFIVALSQRDLSSMAYDDTDPKTRIPFPVGQAQDVYLHYDIDPSLLSTASKTEHELVEYLMTLTDIMNRETFNAINFNLVTSSFSINSKDTDQYVMQEFRDQQVMHEGEAHIWLHVTDYLASSIAGRFGLYDGKDRSYAIAATFNGNGYTHGERTNPGHEIGHLFGLDHTHVLSLSYNDVSVNPDQCGGGPNGADCSTKPAIGGSIMSYCQECPSIYNGGGFKSAKPLTSFHPYQAEKMQEHFDSYKSALPTIQRQKLRTFVPNNDPSFNFCASEGQTCSCDGVVYFGPTLSSSNPIIFGVEHISGSVQCRSGHDKTFADVFHGKSKSCYCHEGADLHDITYTPTDVDFINGGTGECQIQCGYRKNCYWEEYNGPQNTGYFTIDDQPEWKCKQECLDRTNCNGFNFKNGKCRLFELEPSGVSNSGTFYGSTCWKRPVASTDRHPQPDYQIRDVIVDGNGDDSDDCDGDDCDEDPQYVMLGGNDLCPSEASLVQTQEECWHALSLLGLEQLREPWIGHKVGKKPAGCSWDASKDKAHYNTNLNGGLGEAKSSLAPICKIVNDEPVWSDWGAWSECSVECGGGIQTQYRTCLSGPCVGANSRTQTCNNHGCSGSETCEYVAIPTHQCPSGSLPPCVNVSPGSLCQANLVQNGVAFQVNNCGDSDVFQYVCSDTDDGNSGGRSYSSVGFGLCNSATGQYIRGLAHTSLTPDECKSFCDERSDCVGYSAPTNGGRGTCYVHGPYTHNDKPDSTWFTASGGDYEIVTGNGLQSMTCYRVA